METNNRFIKNNKKIKVLLATEGTYPYHTGGVSTWCDALIRNLDNVEYMVYSIVMNPYVTQSMALPDDAKMLKVPLWGTEEPFEHLNIPFSQVYRTKGNTDNRVIEEEFIPLFKEIVQDILSENKKPVRLGYLIAEMYQYFQRYDYKDTFKSEITWEVFKELVLETANDNKNRLGQPSVFSMIQSLGWLYRFFTILYTPVPKTDITHSAAAAFCGIPCVISKILYGTPYLLTEHGVYLREQYLSLSKRGYDKYLSTFFIRMVQSIVKLNYAYADQISPVCSYNTRWETKLGVLPGKIKVIYNGVNAEYFKPKESLRAGDHLRVVAVARVDPVKDLLSMITAARTVKDQIKNVTFHVYGSVTVPEYYEECLDHVKKLNLQNTFFFEGNTNDTPSAYASGDVIILSSITEGFPYSVVEAMMMGKPVVSTNVGGISEAMGGIGLLSTPGKPDELAQLLITVLSDKAMREDMGRRGRERALDLFTIEENAKNYYDSYKKLIDRNIAVKRENERLAKQELTAERGYALIESGQWNVGIAELKKAVNEYPDSIATPVLLNKISEAYESLGDYDSAKNEKMKADLLAEVYVGTRIA